MEIGVSQHLVYDESQDSWINTELNYEDIENMFLCLTPMLKYSASKYSIGFLKRISIATLPDARLKSDFTFINLKNNLFYLLQCVSKHCTGLNELELDLSIHSKACLPGTGGTRPMSMGWPIATDFIFIETVDVLKNNFGSLAKLELTVSADDCINVLFGCTNFTKLFVKGMDADKVDAERLRRANWEKVKKEVFPKLASRCASGPDVCSNITKLTFKSVKLPKVKSVLVKSSIHLKKLETLVLYLDNVIVYDTDKIDIYFAGIYSDRHFILDLLLSTRVMLVAKQAGDTLICFEIRRHPVYVGVIQVIEISPPLH